MEELDKIYDVIKEMVNLGYAYQVDEKSDIGNLGLIKRTSLVKLKGHTMKLEETYKEDTKEVESVNAVIAEDNLENGHGNIINFNNEEWFKKTEISGNILIVDIDYYSNNYGLTVGHTFGQGIAIRSKLHSIDENNVKFYSRELLRELQGLEYFIGSLEERNKKEEEIKQKAEIVPKEKILEALKKLDIEALKTGDFEHKNIVVETKKEEPIVKEEKVEKPKEEEDKQKIEELRDRINKFSPERINELINELNEKEELEKKEKPKYSKDTITRFELYKEFLLNNGARKDIVELPAIKDIILDVIENGDPRVIIEGRSPIVYMDPKEDGTFDIYGRTDGNTASVVYEMELDEQEENGYFISLTKKDIRNYALFDESKRKPDENIYIDREGNIIENQKGKAR